MHILLKFKLGWIWFVSSLLGIYVNLPSQFKLPLEIILVYRCLTAVSFELFVLFCFFQ